MRDIPQLPSVHAITDPQVRKFCEDLTNAWQVRNGDVGDGTSKFLTTKDVAAVSLNVMASVFAGVPGTTGLGGVSVTGAPGSGSNGDIIGNLAQYFSQSELFRRLGQNIARITVPSNLVQFIKGEVEAQANSVLALGAQVGSNQAAITSEQTIRVSAISAVATAINTMWATIAGVGSSAISVSQDGATVTATANTAQATKFNALQSAVFDANGTNLVASVRQDFSTYASNLDGKLNATYTLRVDVGGVVGGFGIVGAASGVSGPTIAFGVRADQFWIAPPTSGGNFMGATHTTPNDFPFVVLTSATVINGRTYQPGVYMSNLIVAQASIDITQINRLLFSDSWDGVGDPVTGVISNFGTQGWAISRGGFAAFNNVTVRGTIFAQTGQINRLIVGGAKTGAIAVPNNAAAQVTLPGSDIISGRIPMVSVWSSDGNASLVSVSDSNFSVRLDQSGGGTISYLYW